jgi:hypothetical protein
MVQLYNAVKSKKVQILCRKIMLSSTKTILKRSHRHMLDALTTPGIDDVDGI